MSMFSTAKKVMIGATILAPVMVIGSCKSEGKQGKTGMNGVNGKDGTNGTGGVPPSFTLDSFVCPDGTQSDAVSISMTNTGSNPIFCFGIEQFGSEGGFGMATLNLDSTIASGTQGTLVGYTANNISAEGGTQNAQVTCTDTVTGLSATEVSTNIPC